MTHLHEDSLIQSLRSVTREAHERLDKSIIGASAFATLAGYGSFASIQYLFHRDIDALYRQRTLTALLPDLEGRRRLDLIAADLRDLKLDLPDGDAPLVFTEGADFAIPTALGWLYVAEGSNLGAAFLRKEAAKLGLSDSYGARHLAPPPEGPAARWRAFTDAAEAVALTSDEKRMAVAGAEAAFARVQMLVDTRFG